MTASQFNRGSSMISYIYTVLFGAESEIDIPRGGGTWLC